MPSDSSAYEIQEARTGGLIQGFLTGAFVGPALFTMLQEASDLDIPASHWPLPALFIGYIIGTGHQKRSKTRYIVEGIIAVLMLGAAKKAGIISF